MSRSNTNYSNDIDYIPKVTNIEDIEDSEDEEPTNSDEISQEDEEQDFSVFPGFGENCPPGYVYRRPTMMTYRTANGPVQKLRQGGCQRLAGTTKQLTQEEQKHLELVQQANCPPGTVYRRGGLMTYYTKDGPQQTYRAGTCIPINNSRTLMYRSARVNPRESSRNVRSRPFGNRSRASNNFNNSSRAFNNSNNLSRVDQEELYRHLSPLNQPISFTTRKNLSTLFAS